jgi:hypothetical protein
LIDFKALSALFNAGDELNQSLAEFPARPRFSHLVSKEPGSLSDIGLQQILDAVCHDAPLCLTLLGGGSRPSSFAANIFRAHGTPCLTPASP